MIRTPEYQIYARGVDKANTTTFVAEAEYTEDAAIGEAVGDIVARMLKAGISPENVVVEIKFSLVD